MKYLERSFGNAELDACLDSFLQMLARFFGDDLVSVVLYGSITFDDLAPGYGDLDFLAVVRDDITADTQKMLSELRAPLRDEQLGIYGTMIEGAFLPERMLDPSVEGEAYWWGTTRDRPWTRNALGWLVLACIRQHGIVILGEDIRDKIPDPSPRQLASDVDAFLTSMKRHAQPGNLHSVDWLLTAARELLLLREGRFSSKSGAADWAHMNVVGQWRDLLPRCKEIRVSPHLADCQDTRHWLLSLDEAFTQAADELEAELNRFTGAS